MKKQYWSAIFFIVLFVHLVAVQLQHSLLQMVSKPLLIPLLVTFFQSKVVATSTIKNWVLAALFFSWVGDVLLMFVPKNEIFFLLGLSAFLLAHICYIIFFHKIKLLEKITGRAWLLLPVVVYYGLLIYLLSPHLLEMKLPVQIYGLVISFMFMLALHMLFIVNKKAGVLMMVGALLFVLSDSILAINKFYHPFKIAGVLIMLTYGLAQYFIVKGALAYLSTIKQCKAA